MKRLEDDDLETLETTLDMGGKRPRRPQSGESGVDSVPAPVDPASGSLGAPISLERYHLRRQLGRGAMGEVHLARDGRIGRDVAMKVLLPQKMDDPQARARFVREARVQGQLEHPSIVPVYDLGIDPTGSVFFTMKCLRGMTLAHIIRGVRNGDPEAIQAYPRRRLLGAFASACLAVDFAHSRGVIHRDLKPSNIMLGDFGEVYVVDWGIAKLRELDTPSPSTARVEDSLQEESLTAADSILGTLGYMPPEQALGKLDALDARTDVYSLGAILFELLTMEPLHPRDAWNAMLRSTLTGVVGKPSERFPSLTIPPELDAIVMKATKLHPEERYQSARELHDAIQSFLDGDRDVLVRQELASRYARAAAEAATKAGATGAGSVSARRDALREVARALALDPSNESAMDALGRVVAAPPEEVPPEVLAEQALLDGARRRGLLREGVRANIVAFGMLIPFGFWMGVRNVPLFSTAVLLTVVATVLQLMAVRVERERRAHALIYGAFLANVVCMLILSRAFGPLFFMPMVLAVLTFAYCMSFDKRYCRIVIATAGLAILGAAAVEWSGLLGHTYVFADGALTIASPVVKMAEVPTFFGLTMASFFFVVAPGLIMARLQSSLRKAEQRSILHVWHLRQLLPVQEAAPPEPPVDSRRRPSISRTG